MKEAADKMYLPFDAENGIYMQDDNFIYKDPIDIERFLWINYLFLRTFTRSTYGDIRSANKPTSCF